jgi:beta-lactamase class A
MERGYVGQNQPRTKLSKNWNKSKDHIKTRKKIAFLMFGTFLLSLFFSLYTGFKNDKVTFSPEGLTSSVSNIFSGSFTSMDISLIDEPKMKSPQELEALLLPIMENPQGNKSSWGVWIEILDNSEFIYKRNENMLFPAASLLKLPLTAKFYERIQTGKLDKNEEWTLKQSDKQDGNGILASMAAGSKIKYSTLAHYCLNLSDNTAFYIINSILGRNDLESIITSYGMDNTSFSKDTTNTQDIAKFFKDLDKGRLLNEEYKKIFLGDLMNTPFDDFIPAGIPNGIDAPHKVGIEEAGISDAGIVYTPEKKILMIFMSKGLNREIATEKISKMALETYWYLMQ